MAPISIEVVTSLKEVSEEEWNNCNSEENPFTSYAFLRALEESGSATQNTGWLSQHLILREGDGPIAAVAPLYLKNHSYGEYVFDWGWADAYERAGGRYYPKLQCAVPFTPVTGPRLMVRKDQGEERTRVLRLTLAKGMIQLAQKLEVSSVHITFPTKSETTDLANLGFLQRNGQQFHWSNRGFKDFDDFLDQLTSRKRKAIKKERKKIKDMNFKIQALSGSEIKEFHWDYFYKFYTSTTDKKWGQNYLERDFFSLTGQWMGEKIVLITVEHNGELVAGALNLRDRKTLYGRNWGCLKTHKFLHFETCYYQAIEYAIENGLQKVEAGAQGHHKIQRGYLPMPTWSLHWIADPRLRSAIQPYLESERLGIDAEMRELMEYSPYKNITLS